MDDTVKRALALLRQGIAGTKEVELVIAYIKQLEEKLKEKDEEIERQEEISSQHAEKAEYYKRYG